MTHYVSIIGTATGIILGFILGLGECLLGDCGMYQNAEVTG